MGELEFAHVMGCVTNGRVVLGGLPFDLCLHALLDRWKSHQVAENADKWKSDITP